MPECSFAEFFTKQICDLKTVCDRNICDLRKLIRQAFNAPLSEILNCLFTNRQNHIILTFCCWFQTFKKVCIISASQTSVTGNRYIAVTRIGWLSGVYRRKINVFSGNVLQCLMQLCEVRTAGFCTFLCLTQFGGCNKLHGLGNLHRTLYAFDTQLYRFHISSHMIIPS